MKSVDYLHTNAAILNFYFILLRNPQIASLRSAIKGFSTSEKSNLVAYKSKF